MTGRKKHSWKRAAALLLVVAMIINMIPADVFITFAATATHQNDFTVTVKDSAGNSIPNAIVSVTYGEAGTQLVSIPSDGNGEVVISQLTDGTAQAVYGNTYTISCSADSYVSETKRITVDNTDTSNVDIVLYESVTLTGLVSYNDVPESGATVAYTGDGITAVSTITGETGNFAIPNARKTTNAQLTITSTNEKFQKKVYNPVFAEEATVDCGNITLDVKTFDIIFTDNGIGTFADEAGNDIPNNTWNVEYGTDVAFTFTATEGYEDVAITVNGTPLVEVDGKYVISGVTAPYDVVVQGNDNKAPKFKMVAVSDAENWTQEKEITFSVEDNSGKMVTTYISKRNSDKDEPYNTYEELQNVGVSFAASPYKVTEEGTYDIYAVDAVGNLAFISVDVLNIDTNEPEASIITPKTTGYGKKRKITYSFSASDQESGIKSVKYSSSETGENATTISSYTGIYSFSAKNNNAYYVFIEDNAGNINVINTKNSDLTSPEISVATEFNVWVMDSIAVEFVVTDNEKVESIYWSTEDFSEKNFNKSKSELLTAQETGGYSFVSEKNGTYYIYAFDATGNMAMEKIDISNIDEKVPVVSVEKNPDTTWANKVELKVTATDDGSGVREVSYKVAEKDEEGAIVEKTFIIDWTDKKEEVIYITREKDTTYEFWAVDNVGRTSVEKPIDIDVKIDKEPAQISSIFYKVDENNVLEDIGKIFTYGLAFREKVIISIDAIDNRGAEEGNCKDSGISEIQYLLVEDGDELSDDMEKDWKTRVSYSEDSTDKYAEEHVIELVVGEDIKNQFKGSVYIRVVDFAGNISETKTAADNGTTIVTDNKVSGKPEIKMTLTDTENGYTSDSWTNSNVEIVLSLPEKGKTKSGIKTFQYRIVEDRTTQGEQESEWCDMPDTNESIEQKFPVNEHDKYVKDKITISGHKNAIYEFRAVNNAGVEGLISDSNVI